MKKYNKWIEERPTIHNINLDLDINDFRISVHQYVGCGKHWYLSTNGLDITRLDLETTELETAKSKAITFIKAYVDNLIVELGKI